GLQQARALVRRRRYRALLKDRRRHFAGQDRGGADAVGAFLHVEGLGERDHGVLGGVVAGTGQRARVAPGPRGDVDDQALLALAHRRQHRVAAIEHAGQVDGDDLIPAVDRNVSEVALRQVDARAVDEDVDAAMALEDRRGGLSHLGLVGDVHGDGLALAGRLELLFGGGQGFLAAPRDDDMRAGARELDRAGEADARAAAGDPGNLTGEHTEWYRRVLPPAPC